MIDRTFILSYKSITVPYRYEPSLLTRIKHDHKIEMTRHHDGFVREDAIHKLLSMEPTEEIAAYCIVALADYAIEIGQSVIDRSSPELVRVMVSVVDKNKEVIKIRLNITCHILNSFFKYFCRIDDCIT